MAYPIKSYGIITPTRNAKGVLDHGHAWSQYKMGFTDIFGNRIPIDTGVNFAYVKNSEVQGR